MLEINLLKDQRKNIVARHLQAEKRDRMSVVVVVIAVIILLVLWLMKLGLGMMAGRLEKDLAGKEREERSYSEVAVDSNSIARRLAEIEKIVEGRGVVSKKLQVIFSIFDRGTDLRRMEFGGVTQGESFMVSGITESVFSYVDFADRMKELAEDEGFSLVEQESLARSDDGTYAFTFRVEMGQDGSGGRKETNEKR